MGGVQEVEKIEVTEFQFCERGSAIPKLEQICLLGSRGNNPSTRPSVMAHASSSKTSYSAPPVPIGLGDAACDRKGEYAWLTALAPTRFRRRKSLVDNLASNNC
jgi:hypothetical protein